MDPRTRIGTNRKPDGRFVCRAESSMALKPDGARLSGCGVLPADQGTPRCVMSLAAAVANYAMLQGEVERDCRIVHMAHQAQRSFGSGVPTKVLDLFGNKYQDTGVVNSSWKCE